MESTGALDGAMCGLHPYDVVPPGIGTTGALVGTRCEPSVETTGALDVAMRGLSRTDSAGVCVWVGWSGFGFPVTR